MKKYYLIVITFFLILDVFSQNKNYWQQSVKYNIEVRLIDSLKTLDGNISIHYKNNSPDTLKYIWFHLWPNAYKNDRTALSEQLLKNRLTDLYFSDEIKKGLISNIHFKINNVEAKTENHPLYEDIIKLILTDPLLSGDSINIETPFYEKLPYNFSRGGYVDSSFQITQWYPKPSVYDKYGWHEMPYLHQGEFYSEFGNYKVSITVPQDYKVAATGVLFNYTEENKLKTLHYIQDNVHDFAWFADKNYIIKHDTIQFINRTIDVYVYHYPDNKNVWRSSCNFIKNAVRTKNEWVGAYPYSSVTVVESPQNDIGGMEYPTITLVEKSNDASSLNEVINHEVGHNWFYGILANNEREHPWMDEGMNTYYDKRFKNWEQEKSIKNKLKESFIEKRITDDFESQLLKTLYLTRKDQAIETKSGDFTESNYALIAYIKTGQWMNLLENEVGKKILDSIMHAYFEEWKFKHPYPEDFRLIAEKTSNKDLSNLFSLLNKKGSLNKDVKKSFKVSAFFNFKSTEKYRYLLFTPAMGINKYDRMLLGGLIHNYTLPFSKFQFIAAPLFSTNAKNIRGLARFSYNIYPGKKDQRITLTLSGSTFSNNLFIDSSMNKNLLYFKKIVPGIQYSFAKKTPISTATKYLQWKTFFINEKTVSFSRDLNSQTDIISFPFISSYLNQLQYVVKNERVLYPYSAIFSAEQAKQFIRLGFTGNYFFNYPKGGGLSCRLFAGKFIYTTKKTFLTQYQTERYHLNMSGANGYEDYTFSSYFSGRNEAEGFTSQQIMIKDGGFKVKTDLLSNKVGKSDNWIAAINLCSTIPDKLNPLSLLPVKLPIRLFADVGINSDTWKNNLGYEGILYDAGFQLSLLKNILNIYFPVMYSKSFKDYFSSTITEKRFLKTISFSIDLQNITIKTIFPQAPF